MATWSSAYELTPAQSDPPSSLGTTGRGIRVDIRERWENEHSSYTTKGGSSGGTVQNDMIHKQGSARAYYQSSSPTLRPDGSTSLGSGDAGRLWVDTSRSGSGFYALYVHTGSAWQAVNATVGEFRAYHSIGDYGRIVHDGSVTHVTSYNSSGGADPLLLNAVGSWVAVNYNSASNPGYTFYVNGSLRATSSISTGGAVSCGTVSCSGTVTASTISALGGNSTIRLAYIDAQGFKSRAVTSKTLFPDSTYIIPAGTYFLNTVGEPVYVEVQGTDLVWRIVAVDYGFIVSDGSRARLRTPSSNSYSVFCYLIKL